MRERGDTRTKYKHTQNTNRHTQTYTPKTITKRMSQGLERGLNKAAGMVQNNKKEQD